MTRGADDAWSQSPEENDRDLSDNEEPPELTDAEEVRQALIRARNRARNPRQL